MTAKFQNQIKLYHLSLIITRMACKKATKRNTRNSKISGQDESELDAERPMTRSLLSQFENPKRKQLSALHETKADSVTLQKRIKSEDQECPGNNLEIEVKTEPVDFEDCVGATKSKRKNPTQKQLSRQGAKDHIEVDPEKRIKSELQECSGSKLRVKIEVPLNEIKSEPVDIEDCVNLKVESPPKLKRSPNQKSITYIEPPFWRQTLDNLRQMRSKFDAPVDSMGCDKCADEKSSPEVIYFLHCGFESINYGIF